MATPTLDAYRQLNPQDTRPDTDVVPELISRLQNEGTLAQYPDLTAQASAMDKEYRNTHRLPLQKEFIQGALGGIDTGQGMLYNAAAQAGGIVGSDDLKAWGLRGFQRNVEEAGQHQLAVPSASDVHNPMDALYYGVGLAGSQAPIVGATMAAAAGGGLLGATLGPEGAVAGAGEATAAALGAARAAAIARGSTAGLTAAGYVQSQNYSQLVQSGGKDPELTSAIIGIIGGKMMTMVPSNIIRATFGATEPSVVQMTMEQLLQRAEKPVPGLIESIGHAIAEHGSNNALLGVGQELVAMAGEEYAHRDDPSFSLSGKEITDRLLNGAAAGGALGAVFGAAGANGERNRAADVRDLAKARIADLKNKKTAGAANFISFDPYAGLNQTTDTEGTRTPVDELISPRVRPDTGLNDVEDTSNVQTPVDQYYAQYRHVFDDTADQAAKKKARDDYETARQARLYAEQRALEQRLAEAPPTPAPQPEVPAEKPLAPATFHAIQEGIPEAGIKDIELYNLTQDIPGHPKDSTVSRETLEKAGYRIPAEEHTAKEDLGPLTEPPGPMEFGDLKEPHPNSIQRNVVKDIVPELRKETTSIPREATSTDVEELARRELRPNETGKDTTKKLIAIRDNNTGKVTLMGVYRSTGGRMRVDSGVEPRYSSKKALADALGLEDTNQLDRLYSAKNRSGEVPDTFLSDLLKDKSKTPIAFLDALEPVGKKHFELASEDKFKDLAIYKAGQELANKGDRALGGSDRILKKLDKVSSRDSRAVQLLATVLENTPEAKKIGHGLENPAFQPNATNIIKKLLASFHEDTFSEKVSAAKTPEDLLRRDYKRDNRYFGLFTPEQWGAFKDLTEKPKVTVDELQNAVYAAAQDAKWTSKEAFVSSVIPREGKTQTGETLNENKDAATVDEHGSELPDGPSSYTGDPNDAEKVISFTGAPDLVEDTHNDEEAHEPPPPETAQAIVGLSNAESGALARAFRTDEAGDFSSNEAQRIMEARADSEIGDIKQDLEFQAVKEDLRKIVEAIFSRTRREAGAISDNFLYGIYANLDKSTRDSQANPSTYRVSNDTIARTFHGVLGWLGDKGVDVRLIQKNLDSQVEFLRKEWGRSIAAEDGRRMILLTMSDVTNPSKDNLRTLMHEVAHQMFADEPVWVQRLLHESVERLNEFQMDVFSKTYDDRIKNKTLPNDVMMEEILAEHLGFFGVEQSQARTLGQRFIDGIKKVMARAVLLYSGLRGTPSSPEWVAKYMQLRFRDMLDKVLSPRADFDTLTGSARNTARHQFTFFKSLAGGVDAERFDPASRNWIPHDVVENSTRASEFNLDNRLSYHDVVIRDSRGEDTRKNWTDGFGISEKPANLGDVLSRISGEEGEYDFDASHAIAAVGLQKSEFAKGAIIKFASTPEEMQRLNWRGDSPAVYYTDTHTILIHPERASGYGVAESTELIIHEAQHAATSRAVGIYDTYKRERGTEAQKLNAAVQKIADSGATLAQRAATAAAIKPGLDVIGKADAIFKHLQKQKFEPSEYGMTNLDEFMSEAVANRTFQMKLAKVELPENLRISAGRKSVFQTLVNIIHTLLGGRVEGNALESSLAATERLLMVADPLLKKSEGGVAYYGPPVTQADSDLKVKTDFEFSLAKLNTQSDFYHKIFDKAAAATKLDFGTYLKSILGIFNPESSVAQIQDRIKGLDRQLQINDQMRLDDSQGTVNRVSAQTDRAQITKSLLGTVSDASGKLISKMVELKAAIPDQEKDLEKAQNRFVRFDQMLHDVTTFRDNALKILRKGLKGAERNAERLSQWGARHDGLAGVAAELFGVKGEDAMDPEDVDLVSEALDDHSEDFFITDTLTAATKHHIDFDLLTPKEIERKIQETARATQDQDLLAVADGSPIAKAELALLIYYAKTAPEDMAAMQVRVEADPERKDQIIQTIKKIIRGNYESVSGINDLFKDVRSGDVQVGKAKSSLSNAVKQLTRAKEQLATSKLRTTEMESASKELGAAIKKYQTDLGIRASRFEPHNGAAILLTDGDTPVQGTLKLGPNSGASVNKILMDNIRWRNEHKDFQDPTWWEVNDQIEGLKRVAGDQIDRSFRDSWLTRTIGSLPERLNNLGLPMLRQAGNRMLQFYSQRKSVEPLISKGYQVTEAYVNAMKATGFEKNYTSFKDTFWNPGYHFLGHENLFKGETFAENESYAKERLRSFFMRNDVTREALKKPGSFDAVWAAMKKNYEVSDAIAKKAAEWKTLVEDEDIRVVNPRTGKVDIAQRPAMSVGLFTTQRNISKIFGIKDMLDHEKGPNGESMWATWAHNNTWSKWASPEEQAALGALFTEEVKFHFVQPYIYDTGTLHFDAPTLLDGVTKNKASPYNVQAAWEKGGGDMTKFANALFDAEYTLGAEQSVDHNARREQFVNETLDFFRKQYKKIYDLSAKQEQFHSRGLAMLTSPMMDNVKAGDFPPEFVDHYVYDHETIRQITHQLAAHSSLGRDLGVMTTDRDNNGGFLWELARAREVFRQQRGEYQRVGNEARSANPTASVKDIEKEIESQLGKEKYNKLKNIDKLQTELNSIEKEMLLYFRSSGGPTRDMSLAESVVGTVSGAMVNNYKSTITQISQVFEPFMVYGIGKTGWRQATRYLADTARIGAGSFVQAVSGEAHLASEEAKYLSELGLGRDQANHITSAQIIADTGRNNVYENRKMLGWLRKGRSLVFDSGIRGPEGEKIAPKLRPLAPFSTMMIALNQGAMESELRLFNHTLKQTLGVMDSTPGARTDPAFQFTHEHLRMGGNPFDKLAFEELKNQFMNMGTTMELETRNLLDGRDRGNALGNIVVPPNLARLIASEAERRMSLPNDISTAPAWMKTSPVGRLAMPLISWSLNKTNQIVGAIREPNGEASRRAMTCAIASLAVGMVPAAVLVSMLTDQYDEQIVGKKSNLAGFNFESPSQTAIALMERVGRVGTFGMAGDLVNGVRVYGTSGDLRGVSLDQRVVFVNTLMSIMGLASTAYNQQGTLTYDSFYRPLINTMGGGGILQNQQILNNITNSLTGSPVFQAESDTTARLNALNYLRAGGRVVGMDVRTGSGNATVPTPIKPWIGEMVTATYGNDRGAFTDAYSKAIEAAIQEGKPDPADYVKRAFEGYHPLRTTFGAPPTMAEVGQIMATLSEKGRADVTQAIQYFNAYAQTLGIKPYDGRETVQKLQTSKAAPNPWAKAMTANPWR